MALSKGAASPLHVTPDPPLLVFIELTCHCDLSFCSNDDPLLPVSLKPRAVLGMSRWWRMGIQSASGFQAWL